MKGTAVVSREQKREQRLELARRIDSLAQEGLAIFSGVTSFESALASADLMQEMLELLTPDVMAPIMALMNTDVGFRTDRPNDKNPKPYTVDEIRPAICEGLLRGFNPVGNEMNIIAGRFYAAKAGYRRKLTDKRTFPGLRNFRDRYEVPRTSNGGAVVKAYAEWEIGGKKDSLELEIPVRLNAGMGADAALGKAERKVCKRVHDILAGYETPDMPEEVDVTPPANTDTAQNPADPPPQSTEHEELEAFVASLNADWSAFDDLVMSRLAPGHEGKYKAFGELPAAWVKKLLSRRADIEQLIHAGGAA